MNIFWTRYLTVAIAGFFAMGLGFTFVPMIPALDGLMGFLDAFLLGAAILDPEFARFRLWRHRWADRRMGRDNLLCRQVRLVQG